MKGTVFRRCTRSGCGARFRPRARTCHRCGNDGYSWAFIVDVGKDAAGKRKQRRGGGYVTKDEAEQAARETLTSVDTATYVAPSRGATAEYLRRWLAGIRVKPTTAAQYRQSAEVYAIPRIGAVALQQLTAEHLDAMYRELERHGKRAGKCATAGVTCAEHDCEPDRHKGLAPKSVRHVHTMLRKALQDAVERGHVARNVADLANPPTQRQARSRAAERDVWTADQLRAFLASVAGDRLYAAWLLLATTGLRRGELLGLRWPDVDLDAGRLRVTQTLTLVDNRPVWSDEADPAKSDAGARTIALDAATVAALKAHRSRQREDRLAWGPGWHGRILDGQGRDRGPLVFTREDGSAIHPERFSDWLEQRAKAAGLPLIGVHGVRHSYATAARRAGMDVEVLSRRLGHADVAITLAIYRHVDETDDAEAATSAAAAILGKR